MEEKENTESIINNYVQIVGTRKLKKLSCLKPDLVTDGKGIKTGRLSSGAAGTSR